ncbi:MAG: hypothetical protein ACLFWL_14030 [Candidatus Brocadiia bacterium]
MTAVGGLVTAMILGFPGIQLKESNPSEWCEYVPAMPQSWDSIEIERMWIRGKPARVVATDGDGAATVEFLE